MRSKMNGKDELRLVVRVARMYHEWGMRQPEIAQQLGISQATISRLLNRGKDEGIVRISVAVPPGVYSVLEENLMKKYGLRDAIVVDTMWNEDERLIQKEIGSAAAYYLESIIRNNEVIGISSWSSTLLAMVDAMHPLHKRSNIRVVQILGGVGNPAAEVHANRLTSRFSDLLHGTSVFLPAPGIVGSENAVSVLLEDYYVKNAVELFDQVSLALVGIGSIEPSSLLAQSGNIYSKEELSMLLSEGAVGDVLLRVYDRGGKPVITPLNNRVISMSLEQLSRVDRALGIAGGSRKYEAILGALRGNWINVLITDRYTAERLVEEED